MLSLDELFLLARIVFGLVFLLPGIQVHFVHRAEATRLAQANGVPHAGLMVPLGGVVIVLGGVMVILGAWADAGALLLMLFACSAAPLMHAFWREQDLQEAERQLAHFMKNLGLAAGAVLIIYVYALSPETAPYSLTEPILQLDP